MARTPFRLKSQGSSFKMMGSSPVKDEGDHTHPHEELPTTEELNVGSVGMVEGGTPESLHQRQKAVMTASGELEKGESRKSKLESTYPGTTWSKTKTKDNPRGVWMTSDGRLLSDM